MTIETIEVPIKAFEETKLEMAKDDFQTKCILANGIYEKHTYYYLIAKGIDGRGYKNFIDVGANYGYYTTLFSKIKKGSKIYSFEPNPDVFPVLSRNIQKNNLGNVKLHNLGLGDHSTEMVLYSSHKDTGSTSLQKTPQHDAEYKVKISTLDEEIPQSAGTKFDFIKVDIQGYDLVALNGGRELIKRDLPDILIEYGPKEINIDREKLLELFIFLAAYEYDPWLFRAHDFSSLEPLNFEILTSLFDFYKKRQFKGHFNIMFMSRLRPQRKD